MRSNISMNFKLRSSLILLTLTLAACTTGPKGVRIENGGSSAVPQKAGIAIRNLSAPEVGQAVVGKTFQYTRKDGTGFVTYNADGSFNYQDDQKGNGTGRWQASGDQYCEVYGSTGSQECGVFKNTGDAFFAANSRLVEMKI
jgi:hypothetical protein